LRKIKIKYILLVIIITIQYFSLSTLIGGNKIAIDELQSENKFYNIKTSGTNNTPIVFPWNYVQSLKIDKYMYSDIYHLLFYLKSVINFSLIIPIDVSVTYPDWIDRGQKQDISIDLSIPDNQSHWELDIDIRFILNTKLLVDLIDIDENFKFHEEGNFTTPLGTQELPFTIQLSKDFMDVGELKLIGIPLLTETVTAKLFNNSEFNPFSDLEWTSPGVKQTTIMAKIDANTGNTTITIGDWKYNVDLGIYWKVDFDFYLDFLNDFVNETFNTNLDYDLGVFPTLRILTLNSNNTLSFITDIHSGEMGGGTYETAISFSPYDWYNNKSVYFSYSIFYEAKIYVFQAYKNWYYKFSLFNNGSEMYIKILDENRTEIASAEGNVTHLNVSFIASKTSFYYVCLQHNQMGPHMATVRTDLVLYPGISYSYPKGITYPYPGDNDYLLYTNDSLWYSFNANIGEEVVIWCYRYNKQDLIDLWLYYYMDSNPWAFSLSPIGDNLVSLRFVINASGLYYLRLFGYNITGAGTFWLDFCKYPVDYGNSMKNAIELDKNLTLPALGPDEYNWGGIWIKTNISKKSFNIISFSGNPNTFYWYYIINATDNVTISNGTIKAEDSSYSFISYNDYVIYILLIPLYGGDYITINKSSTQYFYSGEIPNKSLTIQSNSYFNSSFPNSWNGSYWISPCYTEFMGIYLELESYNGSNFDLFLYNENGSMLLNSSESTGSKDIIYHRFSDLSNCKIKINISSGSANFSLFIYILPLADFSVKAENGTIKYMGQFNSTDQWTISDSNQYSINTINERLEWTTTSNYAYAYHPMSYTLEIGDVILFETGYNSHYDPFTHQFIYFGLKNEFTNDVIYFRQGNYWGSPSFYFYITISGISYSLYSESVGSSGTITFSIEIEILDLNNIYFKLFKDGSLIRSYTTKVPLAGTTFTQYRAWNGPSSTPTSYSGWGTGIIIQEKTGFYKTNNITFIENSDLMTANITNYQWDFDDGSSSLYNQNISKIFNSTWAPLGSKEHNFTITLTITDELGFQSQIKKNVTIMDREPRVITKSGNLTILDNETLGTPIQWTIFDNDFDYHYYCLYRNNTLIIQNQTWNNSDSIIYYLENLTEGYYIFRIIAYDIQGVSVESQISVNVTHYTPTPPDDNGNTQPSDDIPGFNLIIIFGIIITISIIYLRKRRSIISIL